MNIAVVTGASSGIGFAVSRLLNEKGYKVYGISRRGIVPEGCIGVTADVTDSEKLTSEINNIALTEGRIDLLINNAGMGIAGPVENTSIEEAEKIMNTNFFGQFVAAKAVLPHMRKQKAGRIVFISSVAGMIAIPYQSFYSVTKSAVSSLALALRNEVKDMGIEVTIVAPGDAHTNFTASREFSAYDDETYKNCRKSISSMEKDELSGMTPEEVASVIVKAATVKNPKPIYVAGAKYKVFTTLFKILPSDISYEIVRKMY